MLHEKPLIRLAYARHLLPAFAGRREYSALFLRQRHALGEQAADVGIAVASFLEHRLGVDTEAPGLAADAGWRARELDRVADVAVAVLLPDHVAMLGMRVL